MTVLAVSTLLVLAGCATDEPTTGASGSPSAGTGSGTGSGTGKQSKFFVRADYDQQLALLDTAPTGPAGKPWEQALDPAMVKTAKYRKPGPHKICFSNAGLNNPWRQVGFKTMQAEVDTHRDRISAFVHTDAEGKDQKQIADINDLLGKGCDALIVSPNTTATLTPAVEAACRSGLPVVVFDRGVDTTCPVTFINPIGGYGFGHVAAEFVTRKMKRGGRVLALRILPGVDVLETRWSAAKVAFDKAGVDVVGVEFTDGDPARTKKIVNDYIQRYGTIDGVWMDAGAVAGAAVEAFEDAGKPVPPINGEDQLDFLKLWKDRKLTAIAPTYPTYQWRTPVIAALRILDGEQVPNPWKLPQPTITQDNLDEYVDPTMPPLHYAMCGCTDLPGYPKRWK
ncbi:MULTISPECIES: ABC transporter substrate-binding protein [Streptomyces]|nr:MULTISPECIES: ABC transporter substrate-binding protein [Streptomyces]MBP5865255.1 ABC transporter substrate-binding protein [Streptomyces sp. LBUM 1484]MBP5909878.1 ABC transporter substrate-binding protein [Streptomyces sp. LBUM 1478]MBP5933317.1 ABC transporter substrate-binding protein [Streptomyces sp. LBUM 1479]KFG05514.1 ABC transporter substrate-binding protein [Streptomyces scabiei]MBP5874054.1 ABC transporter substrate-binding protein [Streptomyces sp. LBUM 1477]